jgi:DNA repair exonuclease SbcCD ATPase subunit
LIIFKYVRWKNFLSTGNAFTEVQLDRSPTTLIIGENGAGKSTILDALCFGLFGKPFRPINKTQLINSINGRDAVVEVEFTINKKDFRVVRGIKPNIFEVYIDGQMLNQDASARDYQKHLEQQILKLNYKSFTQVVILGSSTFVPFMQLPAKQRREVVEDILDIRIFSLMNMLLKNEMKNLNEQIRDAQYQYDLTSEKIELQQKYIDDLKSNKTNIISELKSKLRDNLAAIKEREGKVKELTEENSKHLDLDSEFASLQKKIKKLHQTEAALDNKKQEHQKYKQFFEQNDTCPTCTQTIDSGVKEEKITEKDTKIGELDTALSELNGMLSEQQDALKTIQGKLEEVRANDVEIAKMNSSLSELNKFNSKIAKDIETYESGSVSEEDKEKLSNLKGQKTAYEELKTKLTEDKFYHDVAKNLLQDSGIKTKIIKQYLPIMNKLINTYLSSMDFFVNFSLDENFNETLKSRYRDEFSYASFSEGEKMRIDLALLFTWRAIAKMKNSTNTNLLILDEIFDSSLDGTGTDDFLKILNTFQDENVFVISHKQDALYDKFRSIIKYEKVKNFSRMAT